MELTILDKTLQEMAVNNWPQFVELMGEKNITTAKVRLLCNSGWSLRKISIKLGVTKNQVEYGCNSCNLPKEESKA